MIINDCKWLILGSNTKRVWTCNAKSSIDAPVRHCNYILTQNDCQENKIIKWNDYNFS